ncbi:MAG: hypothetical protein JWQ03_1081 [Variovorax sp.]|nr:hypothetical protein [Variovorax sp.]
MNTPDSSAHNRRFLRARRHYAIAWVALLALLAASAASGWFHLGIGNLVAGVGIALVKGAIVAWLFMALRDAPPLICIASVAGLAMLLILAGLSLVDFGPRHNETALYQRPQQVPPVLAQAHPVATAADGLRTPASPRREAGRP